MTMTKFSRINKQREEITMRVLEDMEKGGNEWKKPWVEASPLPPHNPVSGTQYSGRNFLYTYVYGMMRGYADPRWATEKQIKEMGWKVPENLQNGRGGINDELGVDIEECMAWGIKHLDEVPGQIHVVNGSPHIATIYVTGPDDRRINDLIFTLCEDGRWSYVSELDAETLARFNEIIAMADRIEAGIVKDDEWRDGMVEQVSGFMDKIKDMDAEKSEGADTVLAETFNSIDALSTDAAIDLLRVYSNCDASGRDAVAKTFYALSGESFDSYLMTASEVCKKTLGMLEPEPPQPAKTKNLSQKTMSSREASNRLSDEIGVKPCTRDEGTVGDS